MWMFAAASTVEPVIVHRETAVRAYAGEPWKDAAVEPLERLVEARLASLQSVLGGRDWLEEVFTAGDLLMIQALRRLEGTGLLERSPLLYDYVARGMARPAFLRAFEAQRDTWLSTAH
ncbi:MAG: hypothetical protein VYB54_09740 [Pseudomonadota bacterium]|nr:hypothetical protein [Pseudomonadota bacterium]